MKRREGTGLLIIVGIGASECELGEFGQDGH